MADHPRGILVDWQQGWVFAMAKSIFARTVEKPVKTTLIPAKTDKKLVHEIV